MTNSDAELEQLTSLFRILSDKTRLTIVFLLSQGERNVTNLCKELNLPQPTVSHHLGLLRESKLVANRRDGKQVFYLLNGRTSHPDHSTATLPLEFAAANYKVMVSPQKQE